MDFLRKNGLLAVVFLTGAAVLVVEVLALRILSPYYGNTIFSASSVISIILAALSFGYYGGGKLADKKPSLKIFFAIIWFSGLLIFYLELFILLILPLIAHNFSIIWGPLLMAVIMFFIPSMFLGTLSPYVIKLQQLLSPQQGIGTISGKVFFWSTFGSILGSLSTGFVLVPNFAINDIIMAVGIFLILLGLLPLIFFGLPKKFLIGTLVLTVLSLVLVFYFVFSVSSNPSVVYREDGVYQEIRVVDSQYQGRPIRVLFQDNAFSSGMYMDSDELLFKYSWYYDIYKAFKPEIKNFLLIGTAAYSLPKVLAKDLPEADLHLVDIEPGLLDIAVEYFDFKVTDKVHDYVDDGRGFLYNSDEKYDYIFGDAYSSIYSLPSHLTTLEFFETVRGKLTEDGIFVVNFIGSLEPAEKSLAFSEIKTFQEVFPNSYFMAVDDQYSYHIQNMLFIAYNSDKKVDFKDPDVLAKLSPLSADAGDKLIKIDNYNLDKYDILTDNYAPVEYLTSLMIKKYQ